MTYKFITYYLCSCTVGYILLISTALKTMTYHFLNKNMPKPVFQILIYIFLIVVGLK